MNGPPKIAVFGEDVRLFYLANLIDNFGFLLELKIWDASFLYIYED